MKQLFKPEIFKKVLAFLIVLLVVKAVWFAVELFVLPSQGIDHAEEKGVKALYYRVKLTPNESAAPKEPTKRPAHANAGNIKDIKLLAVYNASDVTVVTVEHRRKSKVLSKGEEINGFELESAGSNFAIFTKNRKSYKVTMIKDIKSSGGNGVIRPSTDDSQPPKPSAPSQPEGGITDAGDHKIIDKSLLSHYAKNMEDIYKNIGIKEVKEGESLKGFRVTFIRKGSPFAELGVKKDDVIKSINGQEINSYKAAMDMYKDIENINNLTLGIKRGNEEMELEYEVN